MDLYKEIIDRYVQKYPQEWADFKIQQVNRRNELLNQFGAMPDEGAFRFSASVPEKLDRMLKAYAKSFLNQEDYLSKGFLERFPVFKIAEKI